MYRMPRLLRQWTGTLQLLLLFQFQTSSVRGSSSPIAYDSVTWATKGQDAALSCNVTQLSYRGPIHIILLYHNDSQIPMFYLDNRQGSLQSALEAARLRHPRVRVELPTFLRMRSEDGDEPRAMGEQTLPVPRARAIRSVSSSLPHPGGESVQLVLTGVALPDTGLYCCRVDYKKHQTVNFGTYLNVVEGPWHMDILSSLESYRPITNVTSLYPEGSNLTLICRVTGGVPRPSVSWFDGEKRILLSHNTNDTGASDVTAAQITLVNLSRSDDGRRLRCSASNTAILTGLSGPLAATVTIKVASPPRYIEMRRQGSQLPAAIKGWLEPGSVVAVAVGNRLSLLCESGGALGSPGLTWRLGNQTLDSQAGSGSRVIISESLSSSGALLSQLSLVVSWGDHKTLIECRIRPPAFVKGRGEGGVVTEMEEEKWSLRTSLSLRVHGPPNVTISMAAAAPLVGEGVLTSTRVVLLCAVTSLPAMHALRWYHNGDLILFGENGDDDTGTSTDTQSTEHSESGSIYQTNTLNATHSQTTDWDDVRSSDRSETFQDQSSGDGLDDNPFPDEILEEGFEKQHFKTNITFESFNNHLDGVVTMNQNLTFYVTTLQNPNQTNSSSRSSRSRPGVGAFTEREARTQISFSGSSVSIITSTAFPATDPPSLTTPYDAKTRLVSDDGERTVWELELSNVRLEHSGKYECQVENSEGSGSSGTVDVVVLAVPRCLHPGGSNVTIQRLGQQLALTCDVVAEPPPHAYRWDVPESDPHTSKGGTLYLDVTESMPAQVACQAENIVGTNTIPCFINFIHHGPPGGVSQCSIVPKRGHDAFSADVTVTCTPGWGGGLLNTYTLQIDHQTNSYKLQTKVERLCEVTGTTKEDSGSVEFDVQRLQTHISYIFTIFAENTAGRGNSVTHHYELDMDNLDVPPVKSLAIEEEEDSELSELLFIVKVVGYAMGLISVVAIVYLVFTFTKKKVYDAMPVLRDNRDSLGRELSQNFPDPNQSYVHFRNDIDKEALLGSKRRSHGLLEIEGGLASLLPHDIDSFEAASPYPPVVLESSPQICRLISPEAETLLCSESHLDDGCPMRKDSTGDECPESSAGASDEGSRHSVSSTFSSSTTSTVVVNPNYFLTPDTKTIMANIDVDETNENNENACRPSVRGKQKYDGDYAQTPKESRQLVLRPDDLTELQAIEVGVKRSKTKSPMLGSVGRYSLKRFRKIQRSDPHVIGCSPDCGHSHKCEGSPPPSVHGEYKELIDYAVPYELKDNLPLNVNFEIVEMARKDENDDSSEPKVNGSLSSANSDTNNNKEPNYDVPYTNDSLEKSVSSTTKRRPSRHHVDAKSILSNGGEGVHEENVVIDSATKQNLSSGKRCSSTPKLKCVPPVYVNIDDCSVNAPPEVKHDTCAYETDCHSYTKDMTSNDNSVIHNMMEKDVLDERDASSIGAGDRSMGTNV